MFEHYKNGDPKTNYEKANQSCHDSQDKYNDVVTFVDYDHPLIQEALHHQDGPLAAIPIALKDNVNTKDLKTTACCHILDNYIPQYNATIVEKLINAGALIMVKSSMDELAMGGTNLTASTGPVANPYDRTRISGGSSGGSAALVASGAVAMAIGTDTGDSIRKPAAYCGVVGFKPTYGRISRYGIIPYSSSLDHVGVFTTSVKDAAISLEVLAGRDDRDMTSINEKPGSYSDLLNSDLHDKTIGIIGNVIDSIDNENILDQFNALVDKLKANGATIQTVYYDEALLKTLLPSYYLIANCEASANHSNLDGLRFGVRMDGDDPTNVMINSRTHGLGPLIRKRFVIGSYGLFEANQEKLFKKAQRIRRLLVNATMDLFKHVDGLLAPAAPTIAPKMDTDSADQLSDQYLIADNWLILGNFTGSPSITVPLGYDHGCPIATNIMTKPFSDQLCLDLASAIEQASGFEPMKGDR